VKQLSELDTTHQYIQGHSNLVADAASRYPLLGPKRLAPRGLANSVHEALSKLPARLKQANSIHVHAGTYTADLKLMLQAWIAGNKGVVQPVAPAKKEGPTPTDFAIMVPRPEDSPITLARYLLSEVPFAILLPNDLLASSYSERIFPNADTAALKAKFQGADKLQILVTQMTWVIGNVPEYKLIEMFTQTLRTPAPGIPAAAPLPNADLLPRETAGADSFVEPVPLTVEDWIDEQSRHSSFVDQMLASPDVALREGLYLYAPDGIPPRIFVPPHTTTAFIRFTHARMYHLGHAKVSERLLRSYYWPRFGKMPERF
jgi:hypothetical protein